MNTEYIKENKDRLFKEVNKLDVKNNKDIVKGALAKIIEVLKVIKLKSSKIKKLDLVK